MFLDFMLGAQSARVDGIVLERQRLTYVDVLREKRLEVLADIEQLRGQAAEIAARIAAKEGQLRNLDDLLALEAGGPESAGSAVDVPARPSSSAQSQRFTDAAVSLLSERGGPIHYQEIARILGEKAVYIPGKDPGANLIAHMLRDPRFGRAPGRGMYGLADWPVVRSVKSPSGRSRKRTGTRRAASRSTRRTRSDE